jgi:hypothetical protein
MFLIMGRISFWKRNIEIVGEFYRWAGLFIDLVINIFSSTMAIVLDG